MNKPLTDYTCPFCKNVQTKIGVTSEMDQEVDLETGEYEMLDQICDALSCFCFSCGEVLPKKFLKILP